jgi:hypothetical protein
MARRPAANRFGGAEATTMLGKGNAGRGLLRLNEGVGEHVRTKIPPARRSPVKLRILCDPHRTKKTCFFCRIGFPKKFDPAV